ncbi:MAG: hypothetical protein R2991_15105 [Thermoanaerobaculia bacterium]
MAVLREEAARPAVSEGAAGRAPAVRRGGAVRTDLPVPRPPDLLRHREELDPEEVWSWINPQMLYAKHLGLRGSVERLREAGDAKLAQLETVVRGCAKAPWRRASRCAPSGASSRRGRRARR